MNDNIINNKNNIFIEKAIKIHGDKYDYSKVNYKNSSTKIIIICKIHGEFLQIPNKHLSKSGCIECGKKNKLTLEKFIEKAQKIHNDKYDYSKVNYINWKTNIIIICKIHGEFQQQPNSHLQGKGCNKCAQIIINKLNSFNDRNGVVLIGESFGGLMSSYIAARINTGGDINIL
jgi:hypothetical protein